MEAGGAIDRGHLYGLNWVNAAADGQPQKTIDMAIRNYRPGLVVV
jgi:hypothetical protein